MLCVSFLYLNSEMVSRPFWSVKYCVLQHHYLPSGEKKEGTSCNYCPCGSRSYITGLISKERGGTEGRECCNIPETSFSEGRLYCGLGSDCS